MFERERSVLEDQVQRLSKALARTHDELVCREEEISSLQLEVQVHFLPPDLPLAPSADYLKNGVMRTDSECCFAHSYDSMTRRCLQKQRGELEQLELDRKRISSEQASKHDRELKHEKDARARVAEDLKVMRKSIRAL